MPRHTLPPWPDDRPLRAWQRAAAAAVFDHPGDAFLASATPAAGKTTFGLHIAHAMLAARRVARVVVVAPTARIARQWAADAARYGIDLEHPTGPTLPGRSPVTVTASRSRPRPSRPDPRSTGGAARRRRRC